MSHLFMLALAQALRERLRTDPQAGSIALAAYQTEAQRVAGQWPDLDRIERCFTDPGSGCLHDSGDWPHVGGPEPVPAWVEEAREAKAAAGEVMEAVRLAMSGPNDEDIALTAIELPVRQPHSTGEWLANLWRSDRAGFLRTYQVLAADPGSQEAIAEARRILGFAQPPPPGSRPAIPRLSHAAIRNSLPLEGHRFRQYGRGGEAPLPPEAPEPPGPPPEPPPEAPRRRRRSR